MERIFMNRFFIICLLSLAIVVTVSCSKKKKLIILDNCGDVERIVELYGNVRRLDAFLYKYNIDTAMGDTLPGCGYLLQMGKDAVQIDTIMNYMELKEACVKFFELDTLITEKNNN
ncbi:MAG: hypothetical protein ABIE07_01890 [Candidatus Zixiibacteriota bacterium]